MGKQVRGFLEQRTVLLDIACNVRHIAHNQAGKYI